MTKRLFYNARILPMSKDRRQIIKGWLFVEGDRIKEVAEGDLPSIYKEDSSIILIDCRGDIILPGFINAHTHAGMIPFRGMGEDLPDRLRKLLFPLETEHMTSELAQLATDYASLEMLLNGITTFCDMYYYSDELVEVVKKTGQRVFLGETIIDQTIDSGESYGGFKRFERLMEQLADEEMIEGMVAPHAPYTNDLFSLKRAQTLAKKHQTFWMMHLHEMDFEMKEWQDKYNRTPIEWMEEEGLLDERLIAVHTIHLNNEDMKRLKQYGVRVVSCPMANMKSGKGIPSVVELLEHDIEVALGTDGPISGNTFDVFELMRTLAVSQKTARKERDAMPCALVLELATIGGAKVLNLDTEIGSLEPGKKADFIIVDASHPTLFPLYDLYGSLVYQGSGEVVKSVYINGQCVMPNRQSLKEQLEKVQLELQEVMIPFLKSYEQKKTL